MKQTQSILQQISFLACFMAGASLMAQNEIEVHKEVELPGQAKPILVSMSGLTGEAATTLQFDLYVQGFAFTNAEAAQYLITGSNNGNLQARATDPAQQEHAGFQSLLRRGPAAAGPCLRG